MNQELLLEASRENARYIRELAAENKRLRETLTPFANFGAWLFAPPVIAPDDTPVIEVRSDLVLTRGDFKDAWEVMRDEIHAAVIGGGR